MPDTRPIPVPPSGVTASHSCRHIPPYYYEEFELLNHTILQLLITDEYLQSLQSSQPWDLETAPWVDDEDVASYLRQVIERVNRTVFQLVHNTLPAVHSLDVQNLEAEAQNFNIGLTFGLVTELAFSKEFIRKLEVLDHLIAAGRRRVSETLLCLKDIWKAFMSLASPGDRKPSPPYTTAPVASRTTGMRFVPEWYPTTEEIPTTTEVTTTEEISTTTEEISTTTEETPTTTEISTTTEEISTTTEVTNTEETPTTTEVTTTEETPTTSEVTTTDEIPTTTVMTTDEIPTTNEVTTTSESYIVEPIPSGMPSLTTDESLSTTVETITTPSIITDPTSEVVRSTTLEESFATPEESLTTLRETSSTTDESLAPTEEATTIIIVDPIPTVEMPSTSVPLTSMASAEDPTTPPFIFDDWFAIETSSATDDDADVQINDTGSNPWESSVGAKPDYVPRMADTTAGDLNEPFCIYPNSATPRLSGPRRRLYGSWVRGRVAGYRLEDFFRSSAGRFTPGRDQLIYYIAANLARVRNLVFRAGVSVETVNGVEVLRIEDHGLLLSATSFRSSMVFTQSVAVDGDVRAANINGVLASAYVTLSDSYVLSRPVVFQNTVSVNGRVAVVSTVNKVDLQAFSRSVALTSAAPQVFSSSVAFASVAAQSVECEVGQVAGVLVSELVLLNETAVITGRKTFLEVAVREGEVQAGRVTADFINGVSVNRLFFDSLRKNPGVPQVVSGIMQIETLVVEEDLTTRGLTTLPSDGDVLDLQRLASRVVQKTGSTATIDGSLAFVGNTFFGYLQFHESFDAATVADYSNGWLLATTEQTITGHLSVVNITSNDVIAAPGVRIQGVDVDHLQNFAVMTHEPTVVTSLIRFGVVESSADVYVDGRVQGWDLSEEGVLQNSTDIVFTSSKAFLSSVLVTHNLHATAVVSNVDLGSLCAQLTVDTLTVYGTVNFKSTVNAGVVHLDERKITGEAVDEYWMTDRYAALRARVRIRRVTAQNIYAQRVNGRDIADLQAKMVLRFCDGSQILTGTLHLLHDLTTDTLLTQALTVITMNGESMTDLRDILTTEGTQVITGHITLNSILVVENVITSSGTLNGVRVTEYCRRGSPCVVFGHKTFREDLIVRGDIDVQDNRTVQGVDVSAAFSHWISRYSCGQIPGLTIFSESLTLSEIRVHGLVNRIKVTSSHLLTRTGQQTLSATFVITSYRDGVWSPNISAQDGLFNTLDLSELLKRAFLLDHNTTVTSTVHFKNPVLFLNANYHIPVTTTTTVGLQTFQSLSLSPFLQAFNLMHTRSLRNTEVLEGQVREYWGWRRVQTFEEIPERLVPLRMDWGETGGLPLASRFLALVTRLGDTLVLEYDPDTDQYQDPGMVLPGRCTSSVAGYASQGRWFVVTGHACRQEASKSQFPDPLAPGRDEGEDDEAVRVWEVRPQGPELISTLRTPGAEDVQVMSLDGLVCLVVVEARGTDTVVACEVTAGVFYERQRIPTTNPTKVSLARHTHPTGRVQTIMAIADPGNSTHEGGSIYVFAFDEVSEECFLMQREYLENAVWVELVSHSNDLLLVALAENLQPRQENKVYIYRMDWFSEDGITQFGQYGNVVKSADPPPGLADLTPNPNFFCIQELLVELPQEARFALIPTGELYLYVITRDGAVTWFSRQGIHRFWKEGELHIPGMLTLEAWLSRAGDTVVHRIAVAGQRCSDSRQVILETPGEVLEMRLRGGGPGS